MPLRHVREPSTVGGESRPLARRTVRPGCVRTGELPGLGTSPGQSPGRAGRDGRSRSLDRMAPRSDHTTE